jgi:hypothetical protein
LRRGVRIEDHLYWFPAGPLRLLLDPDTEDRRDDPSYPSTPPEMVAFGSTGCDGDHYGLLVHAPELELEDYPLGNFCPMDSEGFCARGPGVAKAIGSLLYMCAQGGPNEGVLDIFQAHMGAKIGPTTDDPLSNWPESGWHGGRPWRVPDGWRFVPTRDGIGVLAPAVMFGGEDPEPALPWQSSTVDWKVHGEAGKRALEGGYFGSALLHLREAYPLHWFTSSTRWVMEAMVEAYRGLGREGTARRLEERARRG